MTVIVDFFLVIFFVLFSFLFLCSHSFSPQKIYNLFRFSSLICHLSSIDPLYWVIMFIVLKCFLWHEFGQSFVDLFGVFFWVKESGGEGLLKREGGEGEGGTSRDPYRTSSQCYIWIQSQFHFTFTILSISVLKWLDHLIFLVQYRMIHKSGEDTPGFTGCMYGFTYNGDAVDLHESVDHR